MKNKTFTWDKNKNSYLKKTRGVSFNDIVEAINDDRILDIIYHHDVKYPEQQAVIIEINNYAYIVPFHKEDRICSLITIIPNRKATRKYLGDSHEKDQT